MKAKIEELKKILSQNEVEIDTAANLSNEISRLVRNDRTQVRAQDAASKMTRTIKEVRDGRNLSPSALIELVNQFEAKLR